jgi:thiol:disulfide interchange protein DsbA
MKTVTRWLMVMVLPFLMAGAACAQEYTDGKEYLSLKTPQPTSSGEKIEVMEVFYYGCPHCYRLEPFLESWNSSKPGDVVFVRMPAVFGPSWEMLAKAYYTAELLGVTDKIHHALFKAIHQDKKKVGDVAAVQGIFLEQGVSAEVFNNTFNSFDVSVKLNRAKQLAGKPPNKYGITGVPTIIVNGKYSTSGSQAGSNQNIIKVMDYLIAEERAAVAATSAQ